MISNLVAGGLIVIVAGATGAAVSFGPAELGLSNSKSDNYQVVEKDRSWLDYLPSGSSDESHSAQVEITFLSRAEDDTRRIDLLDKSEMASISLCFAPTEHALKSSCGGAETLGMTTRPVDAPWVGLLGTSDTDFLLLLNRPAPTLDEVASILS